MANARMRLKELADKLGAVPQYNTQSCASVNNAPPFTSAVVVRSATGDLLYSGSSGQALNIKAAQEEAAADALSKAEGDQSERTEVRSQAWLGDAAQDFILALLGAKRGLSAAQLDAISQSELSNETLAKFAGAPGGPGQLASVTLTATAAEASLGRRIAVDADALLGCLLPALEEANPRLAKALEAAVILAAAHKL